MNSESWIEEPRSLDLQIVFESKDRALTGTVLTTLGLTQPALYCKRFVRHFCEIESNTIRERLWR